MDARLQYRAHSGKALLVTFGMLSLQALPNGFELGLRFFRSDAGSQSSIDAECVIRAVFQRICSRAAETLPHLGRHKEVGPNIDIESRESLPRDTDNIEVNTINTNAAAYNSGIAIEFPPPEIVGEYDYSITA